MNKSFANSLTALSIAFASITALAFIAQPLPSTATHIVAAQQSDAPSEANEQTDDTRTAMQIIEDERDELARRAMIRAGTGLHFFNARQYNTPVGQ